MGILVPFKNPRTSEIRRVKLGFSWTILFFGGIFGIPLFMRKLNIWGAVMAALWIAGLIFIPAMLPGIIAQTYLAFRGNRLTAINLLEHGWVFMEPESANTIQAKTSWGLVSSGDTITIANNLQPSAIANNGLNRFCHKCGTSVAEIAAFCSNCGTAKAG